MEIEASILDSKTTTPLDANDFVNQYINIRKKENRIYTNEELLLLPDVSPNHSLFKEWQVRKASARKLIDSLANKQRSLNILEIGCGNGWLSAALAQIKNSQVVGIDINHVELRQAREVFGHLKNLRFIHTNIENISLGGVYFDVIVFAAAIQYFPSVTTVIKSALSLAKPNGEIHVIDSHLYPTSEVEAARNRTAEHYASLGYPKMSEYYFHHSLNDLTEFNHEILYQPSFFQRKVLRNANPFYWIKIAATK